MSTATLLNPGEYREKVESLRVPENCPDEYRKMVESMEYRKIIESVRVRKTILTSIEK